VCASMVTTTTDDWMCGPVCFVCTRPPVRDSVAYGWNGTIASSSRCSGQSPYLITLSDFISLILVNIWYEKIFEPGNFDILLY
jgi:hypothetical protein